MCQLDYVILDLEWNGSYSRKKKGYVNEIIEFGAVKCGENMQMKDSFRCFVKPQITKKISAVISDLTHITDAHLTQGVTFMRAVSLFKKWAGEAVIVTWGTSDILALIENFRYFSGSGNIPFLHQYCDLQAYAAHLLDAKAQNQMGLARAAALLQIAGDEDALHRALEDSKLTYQVLAKLYDKEGIRPFIRSCNDEFYQEITFKTTYISDLSDPLVKHGDLKFSCPKCGHGCERETAWRPKNRGFYAVFHCRQCGHQFMGRLIIKQKYKALSVNKKVIPIPIIEQPRKLVPGPVGDMELTGAENGVGILRFPSLAKVPGVLHGFSTRIGGISQKEFAAMNLGFGRGDAPENVQENYRRLAAAIGVSPESFVAGAQDHNIHIRKVGKAEHGLGIWKAKDRESVDGLCTDEPNVTLTIYCADCVPLYYYDAQKRVIGLAHAGWKGTAAGMAAEMVRVLKQQYGTRPEDLQVLIGPSISKEAFEVDYPVAEVFLALPEAGTFVTEPKDSTGKYHVDLWACNRQFLLEAGVPAAQIHIGGVCTVAHSDLVFSHRKTRGQRGSNCAVLALTE